jgi:hypothetical protein
MKKFLFLFWALLLLEFIVQMTGLFFHQPLLSCIKVIISLPLSLIDRSYPFYAKGSFWFGLTLTLMNIAIQAFIILFIKSKITSKKQLK